MPVRLLIVCTETAATSDLLAVAAAALKERFAVILAVSPGVDIPVELAGAATVERLTPIFETGSDRLVSPRPGPSRAGGSMDQAREAYATFRAGVRASIAARRVLVRQRPDAVVVSTDRVFGDDLVFLAVARRRRILSCVVPFTVSDPESLAHFRRDLDGFEVRGFLSRVVVRLWPKQARSTRYGLLLFFRPLRTIVLAALGLLPPEPWTMGSMADLLFVSGDRDRRRVESWGSSIRKVLVSGRPGLDGLHLALERREEVKARARSALGVEPKQPVVLCGVPHLAEHGMMSWEEHLEHTGWLFDVLRDGAGTALLSLHPKSDPGNYAGLAHSRGLLLSDAPLIDLLPAADVYVATISSTLQWAALLGIPTIVVNHYGLDEEMLTDLDGLAVARSKDALPEILSRLVSDDVERGRLSAVTRRNASDLDVFEGRSSMNVVRSISEELAGS